MARSTQNTQTRDGSQDATQLARLTHAARGSTAVLHVRGDDGDEKEILVVRGD